MAMALHRAMLPIAGLAAVHCAAATENFKVIENHTVDHLQQWSSLVEGLPVPLIANGHIQVPEGLGLGFTGLNDDVLNDFIDDNSSGIFESMEVWDNERAHDRLWS